LQKKLSYGSSPPRSALFNLQQATVAMVLEHSDAYVGTAGKTPENPHNEKWIRWGILPSLVMAALTATRPPFTHGVVSYPSQKSNDSISDDSIFWGILAFF